MRTGAYFVLQVKKSQLIYMWVLHMANFNEYKRQRNISVYRDGCRTPTIARIQTQESLPASRQGIQKFLKKNIESGTIGRQEGSGINTTTTAEVRRLVDAKMTEDDKTMAKEL